MSISFFTRTAKDSGNVTVWAKYKKGSEVDIRLTTGHMVSVDVWNKFDTKTKSFHCSIKTIPMLELEQYTREVIGGIQRMEIELHRCLNKEELQKVLGTYQEEAPAAEEAEAEAAPTTLVAYTTEMINGMANGTRYIKGGRRFTKGTIKAWHTFLGLLTKFEKVYIKTAQKELTFENCNKETAILYRNFLNKQGYSIKYLDKCISQMKTMVDNAVKDEITTNNAWLLKLDRIDALSIENAFSAKIYLNEDELKALANMPLEGYLNDIRNVFLVGCYLGQRVSDYNGFKRDNFFTHEGQTYVRISQKKTRKQFPIPVLFPDVERIMSQYNDELPTIPEPVLNREIKKICKNLSEKVDSLNDTYRIHPTLKDLARESAAKKAGKPEDVGFVRDEQTKEDGTVQVKKWQMVTTHTARRSCITNIYKRHTLDLYDIMRISGHSSEEMLKKYLRMDDMEKASDIAIRFNHNK